MADPVIGATIQVTLERALSLASDRIGLLVGFKKDVASMTLSLGFIKDVLADAEERQNQIRGVQRWLKCLDEVAYDAQNVLETSMTPKGFGILTSLRKLVIGHFSDDGDDHENSSIYNEFDWSGLISSSSSSSSSALRQLFLYGLPHMESLPPQIQHLTTLTSLSLYQFGGVKALPDWFGNFAALEELRLYFFEKLGHLPSEDAMRSLTKLKKLQVYGSPLLTERCTPESSGPDSQWSKVSHIQDLRIN